MIWSEVGMEFRPTMLQNIWYNMSFQMTNLLVSWVYVILPLIYGCSFLWSSWFVHLTTLYIKCAFDRLHFRRAPQVHLKGFCDIFFSSFQYFCWNIFQYIYLSFKKKKKNQNPTKKNYCLHPLQTRKKPSNIVYSDSESVKMSSCIRIEGCRLCILFWR